MQYRKIIDRYTKELLESIIPFWEEHSIDHEYGGFFTFLDRDGSLYDTDKYMWMQWRIVYMFAELMLTTYKKAQWLEFALNGFNFLTKYGKNPSGSYYFALNRQGLPIIAPYNIYSEAFAMMGAASLYRVTSSPEYAAESRTALDKYISRIPNPKGPWEKSLPAKPQRLNLGPQMILANLGIIAKTYLNDSRYEAQVSMAIDAVCNKFWNPAYQMLFENINPDFTFDLTSCEGRHLNPGHGLESMWFALQYAELHHRPDLIEKACHIIEKILDFSWDRKYGGIFYYLDVLGKPHLELQWDMKLWWVHCEALVACLYGYRLSKNPHIWDWFEKIDAWTWTHFPDPSYGEWYGYLNRQGEPTHYLKGGKWKTFFHVPRSLLLSIQQLSLL